MSARLAAIVYSTDNYYLTKLAAKHIRETRDVKLTRLVVIDNGSEVPFQPLGDINVRYSRNIGGNAVFHSIFEDKWFVREQPDFVAFFHCDLIIHEPGWDQRVVDAFDADPQLALIGFVGSNEIDEAGGRGGGTMLNYAGQEFEGIGYASPAEHHGRRITDLRAAAVVDHCAMIFRTSTLARLTPQVGHYAPEHFYDRILSCEVIERAEHIAVLGVLCDHFSGGIGPGQLSADQLRKRWLKAENIEYDGDSYGAVYKESEQRFFRRFKESGFFPFRVDKHYQVHR